MNASSQFFQIDLDAQDAQPQRSQVVEFDDIDTIDPSTFASLLVANQRQLTRSGEQLVDAIEIELTVEQMDAVLEGRWVPPTVSGTR